MCPLKKSKWFKQSTWKSRFRGNEDFDLQNVCQSHLSDENMKYPTVIADILPQTVSAKTMIGFMCLFESVDCLCVSEKLKLQLWKNRFDCEISASGLRARQLKIRAPAATFYGILNADCAQTENLYCLFEAVLESKMSTGPGTTSNRQYRFSVLAQSSTECRCKFQH